MYQKYDTHPTLMQTIVVLVYVLKIPYGFWYQFFFNFSIWVTWGFKENLNPFFWYPFGINTW
jgi:hypothetical protein